MQEKTAASRARRNARKETQFFSGRKQAGRFGEIDCVRLWPADRRLPVIEGGPVKTVFRHHERLDGWAAGSQTALSMTAYRKGRRGRRSVQAHAIEPVTAERRKHQPLDTLRRRQRNDRMRDGRIRHLLLEDHLRLLVKARSLLRVRCRACPLDQPVERRVAPFRHVAAVHGIATEQRV